MPKRECVQVNLDNALPLIKQKCRSNTVFAEKMGKLPQLVTEWKRGKCFPTIEEAVRMCLILECEPEYVIKNATDVEKIKSIIEEERKKQAPSEEQAELNAYLDELKNDPEQRILFNLAQNATKEQLQATVTFLRMLRGVDDKSK